LKIKLKLMYNNTAMNQPGNPRKKISMPKIAVDKEACRQGNPPSSGGGPVESTSRRQSTFARQAEPWEKMVSYKNDSPHHPAARLCCL
jgi:hypothetical protein